MRKYIVCLLSLASIFLYSFTSFAQDIGDLKKNRE